MLIKNENKNQTNKTRPPLLSSRKRDARRSPGTSGQVRSRHQAPRSSGAGPSPASAGAGPPCASTTDNASGEQRSLNQNKRQQKLPCDSQSVCQHYLPNACWTLPSLFVVPTSSQYSVPPYSSVEEQEKWDLRKGVPRTVEKRIFQLQTQLYRLPQHTQSARGLQIKDIKATKNDQPNSYDDGS